MHELTRETFDDFIGLDTPSLVNFWSEGCMPCRMFAPVLAELSAEMGDEIAFGKLRIDDSTIEIAQRYAIAHVPTTILFRDARPVGQVLGAKGKSELQATLRETFSAMVN